VKGSYPMHLQLYSFCIFHLITVILHIQCRAMAIFGSSMRLC
jgi:hypothetical protein